MVFASSCDPEGHPSDAPLFFARLNSKFETGIKSPLDAAILERPETPEVVAYAKVDEVPFDFERRRLSIVVEKDGARVLVVKGAPEGVLACATSHRSGDYEAALLGDDTRRACQQTYESLSARGSRVLAVATRAMDTKAAYGKEDERDLVLLGFLAFADLHVKILTGDNELVTRHICVEVGLDAKTIVLGSRSCRCCPRRSP